MAGTRMPAVRLSQAAPGQEACEDNSEPEQVVVEVAPSSKFGFAWPAEQPSAAPLPPAAERPVTLSSSEGETDVSEEEPSAPVRRQTKQEAFGDDSEFNTPTNHLNLTQNPMDQAGEIPPPPRLSRAFSHPLPSQLGTLRNPRRTSPSDGQSSAVEKSVPEFEHLRELSLELADSVQAVIQMLLQLSPPQVLDPAKEQFSACSLSIPTPSICAMFTSMKNLNYMSANMSALSTEAHGIHGSCSPKIPSISTMQDNFDVGEMLQSIGDALSGIAAQASVDLVLFHGDVGMRHVAVKGDESGLSYTLSHVVRQVIDVALPGDTVEVGLFIEPLNDSQSTSPNGTTDGAAQHLSSPSLEDDGHLRCTFHIALCYGARDSDRSNEPNAQEPTHTTPRGQPSFKTIILRRLLRHIGATLDTNLPLKGSSAGQACELTVTLEPGEQSVANSQVNVSPEDAAVLGFPDMHISNEPTLEQLIQFAESLRGRSVTLYASAKGSFAHHLSSYLTAWGMNVVHMSTEPDEEGEYPQWGEESGATPTVSVELSTPQEGVPSTSPSTERERRPQSDQSFVLIDDDVAVLRSRLAKLKAEQTYPLTLHTRKRPSLASNHRPRSSPQVARVMGMSSNTPSQPPPVVIVHFTSLSNFKLVKDAVQSIFTPTTNGFNTRIPEVIVIPKPAGPRRFLTALHTAVTRPVVDPFFVPTATSPMSPGLHSISPFFNMSGAPKSPGSRSAASTSASVRAASDRSTKSPKDIMNELTVGHAPPSPLAQSEGVEYFSDAAVKLGASPATGLLIQSPDGQPTGIFFHPKIRSPSNSTLPASPHMEPTKAQEGREVQPARHRGFRIPSGGSDRSIKDSGIPASSSAPALRTSYSNYSVASESSEPAAVTPSKGKGRLASGSILEEGAPLLLETDLPASTSGSSDVAPAPSVQRGYMTRRQSSYANTNSPPSSPSIRSPGTRRGRRMTADTPSGSSKKGKSEANIVPPISVLIVDDNPINQTILSTFMKRKRIKYDVAKNGEEAVDKWRSGTFHLILMDIQMPVMDGIQATKEIRRIEKQNGAGQFPSTPQSEGQRTPSETSTTSDSRNASTPAYRSSVIIVALTASSLQADRVAALAAGCNDFLTKPVSLDWLNSKIIEWGSIKALQMWADIRPEVVRSISTGQTAQAQQVARRLHVPEGRTVTSGGPLSRSSSTKKRGRQESSATRPGGSSDKSPVAGTPLSDATAAPSPLSSADASKALASVSSSLSAITAMSPSEAAMTLANAHKPHVPVADVQIPAEALVAAVESAVPSSEPVALVPAAAATTTTSESAAVHRATPPVLNEPSTSVDDKAPTGGGQSAADNGQVAADDGAPPAPPRPGPQ